eukprot:m.120850 g.120850  ORF g.120850 m.120850 type:complete len:78 (+) comp13361_c0_seq1:146-379(+)
MCWACERADTASVPQSACVQKCFGKYQKAVVRIGQRWGEWAEQNPGMVSASRAACSLSTAHLTPFPAASLLGFAHER